jgi:hypothetical protein
MASMGPNGIIVPGRSRYLVWDIPPQTFDTGGARLEKKVEIAIPDAL